MPRQGSKTKTTAWGIRTVGVRIGALTGLASRPALVLGRLAACPADIRVGFGRKAFSVVVLPLTIVMDPR